VLVHVQHVANTASQTYYKYPIKLLIKAHDGRVLSLLHTFLYISRIHAWAR